MRSSWVYFLAFTRALRHVLPHPPRSHQPSSHLLSIPSPQVGTSGAAITALSFSTDGTLLAIGLADGAISLFDFVAEVRSSHLASSLLIPCASHPISLFDFVAEVRSSHLASSLASSFLTSPQAPIVRLHAYYGAVLSCAFSSDARFLLSGGQVPSHPIPYHMQPSHDHPMTIP
jgi:WD40 repeat protein